MNKRVALLLSALLAVLYGTTESVRYGDATNYANEIVLGQLIEPGHMLWRPLATVIAHAAGVGASASDVLWILEALSLLFALSTAVALFVVARLVLSRGISLFVAALGALSNGFWTYSFSGCSYALSELLLVLALYAALRDADSGHSRVRDIFVVGICGGLAASAWAAQTIAAPALFALVLLAGRPARNAQDVCARALWLGTGYAVSFAIPLLVLYALRSSVAGAVYVPPGPGNLTFFRWLGAADHGIEAQSNVAQLLRVTMGWAQSFASIGNLGQDLRLWLYKESSFPVSAGFATLTVFYVAAAGAALTLAQTFNALNGNRRALIIGVAVVTMTNLVFGYLWQGTDLERYFPSLPFQALGFGLAIECWHTRAPRTTLAAAASGIVLMAMVTWVSNFRDVLGPNSLRQMWNHELASHCQREDVVFVLGYGKFGVGEPHNGNFPTVVNVSGVIVMKGERWRIPIEQALAAARSRNGRVLIGDSVLRTDSAPREGWSFVQHPHPSATEISGYFRTLGALQPAFVIAGEHLWLTSGRKGAENISAVDQPP